MVMDTISRTSVVTVMATLAAGNESQANGGEDDRRQRGG